MAPRTSPLDEKVCRSCLSFSDYVKASKKKLQESTGEDLMCVGILN